MCGACWPNQRVHSCYGDVSPACIRCGHPNDTEYHTFWECRTNLTYEDNCIVKTNHLAQAAKDGIGKFSCMWLRGILPLELASIRPLEEYPGQWSPPDIVEPIYVDYDIGYPNITEHKIMSGTYYGDASGGAFSSMTMLRRCGV